MLFALLVRRESGLLALPVPLLCGLYRAGRGDRRALAACGALLVLAAGIILTGIGAAMSLNMRIIPNPGDGIVQAISDCIEKSVGFTKNCFDLFNICLTTFIGLIFAHKLIGIGLGTVIAVLGVGRVIAVFNHLFMKKMTAAAGVEY